MRDCPGANQGPGLRASIWARAQLITDPASIEAAWLAFHADKAVDTARASASQFGSVDGGRGLARFKGGQVADRSKTESHCRNNEPYDDERNFSFHGRSPIWFDKLTFFSPASDLSLDRKLMLHGNIACAAKSETCCRTPISAVAALD
jgi:hypothetical protein